MKSMRDSHRLKRCWNAAKHPSPKPLFRILYSITNPSATDSIVLNCLGAQGALAQIWGTREQLQNIQPTSPCVLNDEISSHWHLSMIIPHVNFFDIRFLTLAQIHQKPNVENPNYESLSWEVFFLIWASFWIYFYFFLVHC